MTFPATLAPARHSSVEHLETRIAPASAVLDLGALTPDDGFRMPNSGSTMSGAGDVNGDGFADVILGDPFSDAHGSATGSAYVIFGGRGGFGEEFTVAALDGTNGFRIDGANAYDRAGEAVGAAGDVNGDGFGDLLIGTRSDSSGGAAYVVFGKAAGFPPVLELSAIDGTNGFRTAGPRENDRFGQSLSSAGDMNGDGFADVAVGAYYDDPAGANSGAVYVIFGHATEFPAEIMADTLNGSNGFKVIGAASHDRFGNSIARAGDVNGDGFGDLLAGAFLADPNGHSRGAAYVVFGKSDAFAAEWNITALDGANGFRIDGEASGDSFGFAVSGAGDVNGDGYKDVVIGAQFSELGGFDSGAGYVVFGKAKFSRQFALSTLDGTNGFRVKGDAADDRLGRSVSGGGDINGDGLGDVILGAPHLGNIGQGNDGNGAAYVIFGQRSGFSPDFELATLNGKNGFRIDGTEAAGAGWIVRNGGDFNGDGRADILVAGGGPYLLFDRPAKAKIVELGPGAIRYADSDGDRVTIRVSSGDLRAEDVHLVPAGEGAILSLLDLTRLGTSINGADLSITVKLRAGGDGLAEVGRIDARGVDLGRVEVMGDLSSIKAGDDDASTPGLASVSAASLGKGAEHFTALRSKIAVVGSLGKVKIAGDVERMTIAAGSTISRIKIGGSLVGSYIAVPGNLQPASPADAIALGDISVGGDFLSSSLRVGYDLFSAVNADAGIGSVFIGQDFEASDIIAGVLKGNDSYFGNADDVLIPNGNNIVAKIASVIIEGTAAGTADEDGDHYGIVAEEIQTLVVGRVTQPLTPGPRNDLEGLALASTGDVRVREVE